MKIKRIMAMLLCATLAVSGTAISAAAEKTSDEASSETRIIGDVDNDGGVSAGDSLKALRASVKIEKLDDVSKQVADVDEDQMVTSGDALDILRYSVGLPSAENIGKEKVFDKVCSVTFNTDGGTEMSMAQIIYGNVLGEPEDPVKDGFIFSGWFTDSEFVNAYDFSTAVTKDVTLYAKWVANDFVLSSDKDTVLIGSGSEVRLYLQTDLAVDSIALNYGVGEDLSNTVEMLDNGSGADDMAGDGIYSAKVTASVSEDSTVNFEAQTDEKKSNKVSVKYYTPISNETIEAMNTVQNALDELTTDEKFEAKSEDDKVSEISKVLKNFEESGEIADNSISINKEASLVSFVYPEGILGGISYGEYNGDMNDISGSDREESDAAKIQINASADGEDDDVAVTAGDADDSEEINHIGNAVILNSFPAFETDPSKISDRTEFYENLEEKWEDKGLETTLVVDATVQDYKSLDKYKVAMIATHGGTYSWTDGFFGSDYHESPAICLAEVSTSEKDKAYEMELKDNQIVKVYSTSLKGYRYWLLPHFIEQQYDADDLANTFVLSECCEALGRGKGSDSTKYDYSMANAFLGKAAKGYIGFHNSVFATYSRELMEAYVDGLIAGDNSKTAYDNAIAKMGENHEVWWNNTYSYSLKQYYESQGDVYDPLYDVAYPVRMGNGNAALIYSGIINGGFEKYNLETTSPNAWDCDGDVRTLTQLGDAVPFGDYSKRMAIVTSGIGSKQSATFANGTEGSSMSQTFLVPDGATKIYFDYNFVSEEPMEWVGSQYDDSFRVQLKQGGDMFYDEVYESINGSEWQEIAGVDFAGGDKTAYQTGWKSAEIDVSEYRNKVITLSFVIYDVGDQVYDSACLVDNVSVE